MEDHLADRFMGFGRRQRLGRVLAGGVPVNVLMNLVYLMPLLVALGLLGQPSW